VAEEWLEAAKAGSGATVKNASDIVTRSH